MRASLRRPSVLGPGLGCLLLVVLFSGCDRLESESARADRRASAEMDRLAATSGPQKLQQLKSLAAEGTLFAAKGRAKAMVAEQEVRAASDLTGRIDQNQERIAALVWEISEQGAQIAMISGRIKGYQALDPQRLAQAGALSVAQIQGDQATPTWTVEGGTQINSLSLVKQEKSRLEGQITRKEEELSGLKRQREGLMDQAQKAMTASESLQGQDAVQFYIKGTLLRREGGEVAREMELAAAELAQLRRDLAMQQAQEEVLGQAVSQVKDHNQQLEAAWGDVAKRIAAQKRLAKGIVDGSTASGASPAEQSMTAKAKSLNDLEAATQKLRSEALDLLSDARRNLQEAQQAEQDFVRKNSADPAMAAALKLHDPQIQQYSGALVEQMIGDLKSGEYLSLASIVQLQEYLSGIFKDAALDLPAEFAASDLKAQAGAAKEAAEAAYKSAEDRLSSVASMGAGTLKTSAADSVLAIQKARGVLLPQPPATVPQRPTLPVVSSVAVPVASAAAPANAPAASGAGGEEREIKSVVLAVVDAMEEGDVAKVRELVAMEASSAQYLEAPVAMMNAVARLRSAVSEKFGPAAVAGVVPVPDVRATLKNARVKVDGQSATVGGPGMFKLQKQGTAWKVVLDEQLNASSAAIAASMAMQIGKLADDVAAGKYQTIDELRSAVASGPRGAAPAPPAQ